MEFSVDLQMRSHTAAAFQVGSDPAFGIVNYFLSLGLGLGLRYRKMRFASLSLSRVRVRVRARVRVGIRVRASRMRGLLYGIDVSEKGEG